MKRILCLFIIYIASLGNTWAIDFAPDLQYCDFPRDVLLDKNEELTRIASLIDIGDNVLVVRFFEIYDASIVQTRDPIGPNGGLFEGDSQVKHKYILKGSVEEVVSGTYLNVGDIVDIEANCFVSGSDKYILYFKNDDYKKNQLGNSTFTFSSDVLSEKEGYGMTKYSNNILDSFRKDNDLRRRRNILFVVGLIVFLCLSYVWVFKKSNGRDLMK